MGVDGWMRIPYKQAPTPMIWLLVRVRAGIWICGWSGFVMTETGSGSGTPCLPSDAFPEMQPNPRDGLLCGGIRGWG